MLRAFLLSVLAAALVSAADDADCPKTLIATYYSELGCEPRKENGSPCPTSYDCSKHEARDKTKCHYAGKAYSVNETLDTPFGSCKAACRCQGGLGDLSTPSFNCAQIECPIGLFKPRDPNCRYLYKPGDCCSSSETCGDEVKAVSVTCDYDNNTYIAGEKFEGKFCKTCYCKENFEGRQEEPFCYDLKCDYQLSSPNSINEGCVPVYYGKEGCCPISWQCPAESDKIQGKKTKIRQRTNESCKFGSLTLEAGDRLETSNERVLCVCQVPPYVTCYQPAESS